jgi:ABC-type dipeptide/oligopeptide/nickel transport system permease component
VGAGANTGNLPNGSARAVRRATGTPVSLGYLAGRLGQGMLVLLGVSVVVFGLSWLTGDPSSVLLPPSTPPEQVAAFRHRLGLDQPVPIQYLDFVGRALHGDFGISLRDRTPALPLVLDRLPATLELIAAALTFALLVAVPLGIAAAVWHGRWPDALVRAVAVLGQSTAAPWLAAVLIIVFAVQLRWLPSSGANGPQSLILPAIVTGAYTAAGLTRLLRSSLLDVLGQDFIRLGYAKGLSTADVVWRHALRNAALPVLAYLAVQVTFLFGGTVVAETVFAYPGVSRLAVQAVQTRDLPVIQVFVLLAAAIVVVVNLLGDLVNVWLDPRIRLA